MVMLVLFIIYFSHLLNYFSFINLNYSFSCGEMENGLTGTKNASPCKNGQKILYAWAKNAPKLDLPEGVGFKVGGRDSDVNYLVLQVPRLYMESSSISLSIGQLVNL